MSESVYIVTRNNPDMKNHMVEIKGVFKDKEEAIKHRQYIWDKYEIATEVVAYFLMDTVEYRFVT